MGPPAVSKAQRYDGLEERLFFAAKTCAFLGDLPTMKQARDQMESVAEMLNHEWIHPGADL